MLRTRLLIVPALAFTVAMTPAVPAATIHVDVNCPGSGDGSIGDPYCSIQTAIDNALDTDEIVVADGTYTGPGNRDLDFGGKLITLRRRNGPGDGGHPQVPAKGQWPCALPDGAGRAL